MKSTTKKHLAFAAAALCLSAVGCSKDAKDTVHNMKSAPQLQGSFTDICSSSKLAGVSEKLRLEFQGNQYTRSQIFYSEANCVNETGRIEYKGEFVAGEENSDPTKGGTLDLNVEKVTVKTSSDTLATALNAVNYCGHSDFANGKEITLSGKQTQGLCPLENVPVKLYTVYKVKNDTLYLGDKDITSMTSDVNARVPDINYDRTYNKDK